MLCHIYVFRAPSSSSDSRIADVPGLQTISQSPTQPLILVRSNIHSDVMSDSSSGYGHHTASFTLEPNTLDSVNNSGIQYIAIALRYIPDSRDARPPHFIHNLSALTPGPPPVAIPWWMTLLAPPTPHFNSVVRPELLPLHLDQALPNAISSLYSDMLRSFSFFVGGGYTSPSG